MKTYVENHYGDYRDAEQSNSIRACGATIGGGSEVLIVDTLVFDEGQITCPTNGLNPQWGGNAIRYLEMPGGRL